MPSALETLVKILKLEREQGCNNTAVIGGLAAFGKQWVGDAHKQARKPEHHRLVDELEVLLTGYEAIESRTERHERIQYMMDRIMGRVPPPPEYQVEPELTPEPKQPPARSAEPPPPPAARPPKQARGSKKPRGQETTPQQQAMAFETVDEFASPPDRRGGGSRPQTALDINLSPVALARPPRRPRPPLDPAEAADILGGVKKRVSVVKGVGERMAESFARLGVHTVNDLLYFLPRRYDDYTQMPPISQLKPDMTVVVIGTVRHVETVIGRSSRKDFRLVLDDGTGLLNVIFFGQHFISRYVRPGDQLTLSGTTTLYAGRLQMNNPLWEHLDSDNLQTVGIVPVYSLTEGLKARGLRRLMKTAVEYWADRLPDYIPEPVLERGELADLGWALRNIHFPEGWDHLEHARRRLTFDDLLLLQLAILGNRRDWQALPADPLYVDDGFLETFLATVFPYELTGAQRRAVDDIRRDISAEQPMNRLLQGDVGSGKTAVALTALAMAVAAGKQATLMAPTSILAEQHYRNISAALSRLPGERKTVVALLTSALTKTEREAVYNGMADGSIDIVIGTHAVIQEGVVFQDLGLAIIDEQHRFGVEQRGALRGKGKNPHLLVMTATPIPRTLALTLHADLDLTIIDEMPPGRLPVDTRVIEPIARERAFSFVESQLEQGRQAFIVHPLVEQSDKIDAMSALEAYERLSQVFYQFRVGLLHGRMKPAEKDAVMAAFSAGEYDVLVTTSVAEVGVDVPNASVIVIESANRFGLAQLHQFRGRVGRGEHASYCLLIDDSNTPEARERLEALEQISDGFRLAEIDWKLRGAGDLLGTRQSGQLMFRMADYITPELVELAQREARTIYAEDPYLAAEAHQLLAQRVQIMHDERADIS